MTLFVRIRSFRGIQSADVEMAPVALIAGRNHQGKSSIAQATAAALTNSPIPFFRSEKPGSALFNKGDAKTLVNDTADGGEGGVRLEADAKNRITIGWPELKVKIDGQPPQASKVACGLVTPIDMPGNERAKFYSSLLQSDPTQKDFIAVLIAAKYPVSDYEKELASLWDSIEVSGWDSVHGRLREAGTKHKGAWERVTGTRYGSDKAATFRPQGYVDELDNQTLDELTEVVAKARDKVQKLNTGAAVAEDQIQRLTADATLESEIGPKVEAAKSKLEKQRTALKAAQDIVAAVAIPQVFPCPHCGGMNVVSADMAGTITVEMSQVTGADIEAAKKRKAQAEGDLKKVADAVKVTENEWRAVDTEYKRVQGAGKRLEEAVQRTGNAEGLEAAQDELRTYESQYSAKRVYGEALELHQTVVNNQILIDILDPAGLRQTKLQEKLAMFNKVLAGYCTVASYEPVSITPDLEILLGARHYVLLSDSEKYRCRAILQVATAVYEGSNVAIFDGADILDGAGRNGLFTLLKSLAPAFHAMICMTHYGKQDTVPDISKIGIGLTYWVQSGTCAVLKGS